MIETLVFIVCIVGVVCLTIADAWHDNLVTKELQKLRHKIPINEIYGLRDDSWKFWGNFVALGWITFLCGVIILVTEKWIVLMWIPILYLTWWIVHDFFTGWFILGKPLHLSSDKITQWCARTFIQNGWIYLMVRLGWLAGMILIYFAL